MKEKVILLLLFAWLAKYSASSGAPPDEQKKPSVREDVIALVEKDLNRLSVQAEKEKSPGWPRPSRDIAYLMLTGLAAQGSEIKDAGAFQQLGDTPSPKVRLIALSDDIRILFSASPIQDKAGAWTMKFATLSRRQRDKWVERGSGETAADGYAQPRQVGFTRATGREITPLAPVSGERGWG